MKQRKGNKCKTEYSEKDVKMLDSVELAAFNNGLSRQEANDAVSNSKVKLMAKKRKKIEDLLEDLSADLPTRHLDYFRKFATDGGLIDDRFRVEIWPLLAEQMPQATHLDVEDQNDRYSIQSRQRYLTANAHLLQSDSSRTCSESEIFDSARSSFGSSDELEADMNGEASSPTSVSLEELQMHAEWNQVELDVHRTLARFPPNTSDTERRQLQNDLIPMIVELLYGNQAFRYYQGFHDVCLTLMLALDVDRAKKVGRCLVERGAFRNYLLKSLEDSALKELHLMYVILHKCDPELERKMRHAELGTLFALSWPITWFSHALHSFDQIALCFDLFLSSDALMPIYVSAALVEYRRKEVMAAESEMPVLHHLLNHIPTSIDIEAVLKRAQELFNMYRPKMIQGEFSTQYEAMCLAEGRQQKMPPPELLQRHSLQAPWVLTGVAAVSFALYWVVSSYQNEFRLH